MYEDSLTTESLRKKFKNNFNLCNFSIHVGRSMIASGQQVVLKDILEAVDERIEKEKEHASTK
ncbi:MAG TPA: hypothetical protein VJK48_00955 [Chlamydiales bacterium]|nr:hypothetical protein [Chlamydiales bacterium]